MTEKSSENLRQEVINQPEGAERNGTEPAEAQKLARPFDPFHDLYLADPYAFFAQARATNPVFHSPDLDYWVVTRYHDIRHIFQTPKRFSAAQHPGAPAHLPEVTQIVYELLIAGHETTPGLISNAMSQLLTQRSAWEEICRDASLVPNAVEEVLRFDSPVIAWRRETTRAVEIGGVPVPAGPKPAAVARLREPRPRGLQGPPSTSTSTGRMPRTTSR
jgi:cytochrome P450